MKIFFKSWNSNIFLLPLSSISCQIRVGALWFDFSKSRALGMQYFVWYLRAHSWAHDQYIAVQFPLSPTKNFFKKNFFFSWKFSKKYVLLYNFLVFFSELLNVWSALYIGLVKCTSAKIKMRAWPWRPLLAVKNLENIKSWKIRFLSILAFLKKLENCKVLWWKLTLCPGGIEDCSGRFFCKFPKNYLKVFEHFSLFWDFFCFAQKIEFFIEILLNFLMFFSDSLCVV